MREQANRLFALWPEESEVVKHVEDVKDMHLRRYIIELQTRGKYSRRGSRLSGFLIYFRKTGLL